ncbi:FAD-binding oxidoreductase [Pseudonocardia xishanensis]|uniref:FAD-binding oxidoreductase n=1 Tax=Pseudonocardia xishanensis TaxID=630995 RepID=A0ABP8REE3_9PSEU
MTSTAPSDVEDLRRVMTGPVFTPDDADYDEVRKVLNADIDLRPAVVARCAGVDDVVTAVRYAQRNGLEIAVRSGAHNLAGLSSVEDGLVVDLSGMRSVEVDPVARRARVQGGALLADLDAATQEYGLAVPSGLVGHTGVGGLTLGGGMGWLTRKAGLAIDNLVSAEIVVADGSVLRLSESENADLFWAIRGGGGNFGVVTEFEFRLHEAGPMVQFGMLLWPLEQGMPALRALREVVADLPPEVNAMIAGLSVPPVPFVADEHHGMPAVGAILVGFGSDEEFESVANRIRQALPPLIDAVMPLPYTALQSLFDDANGWGKYFYEKSCRLPDFTDEAIEVILEQMPRRASAESVLLSYRLDAAYSAASEDATAFGGTREPHYAVFLIGISSDPALLPAERAWARSLWEGLRPASLGIGTYINGMTEPEPERVLASYGRDKHARLAEIKGRYDPGNVFHRNANIKPA